MLKSPPAHQQRLLANQCVVQEGRGGNERACSFASTVVCHQDASSCDADDEELPGDGGVYDDDQPLDMSCKRKEIEVVVGVKRGRGSSDDGAAECKRVKVSGEGKRKHLRKKRRDCGASNNGGSSGGARPSVISFAGVVSQDGDGSSSSSSGDEAGVRVFNRRRRKRVWVREADVAGFDVDEHFRRSLGAEWEAVVGKVGGGGAQEDKERGSRVIIEDSIKPSDVDDHFAKALGSETWSKIVASSSSSTQQNSRQSGLPQRNTSTPITPPRSPPVSSQGGPVSLRVNSTVSSSTSTISTASSNYKIDAILGNTRGGSSCGSGGEGGSRRADVQGVRSRVITEEIGLPLVRRGSGEEIILERKMDNEV